MHFMRQASSFCSIYQGIHDRVRHCRTASCRQDSRRFIRKGFDAGTTFWSSFQALPPGRQKPLHKKRPPIHRAVHGCPCRYKRERRSFSDPFLSGNRGHSLEFIYHDGIMAMPPSQHHLHSRSTSLVSYCCLEWFRFMQGLSLCVRSQKQPYVRGLPAYPSGQAMP